MKASPTVWVTLALIGACSSSDGHRSLNFGDDGGGGASTGSTGGSNASGGAATESGGSSFGGSAGAPIPGAGTGGDSGVFATGGEDGSTADGGVVVDSSAPGDSAAPGDSGIESGEGGGASDAESGAPDSGAAPCIPRPGTQVTVEPFVSGLTAPLMITGAPGDDRLFVIEQAGVVKVIKDGVVLPTPFLDLSGVAGPVQSGGEQGLLGIAFHPDFQQNHKFYLHFTRKSDYAALIAEFLAVPGTDAADPASQRDVLSVADPASNNNGGMITFGLDDMLYIALGDGGGGGSPPGPAARDTRSLLGKILRIDVDTRTGTKQYGIPAGNPFAASADTPTDPRPEVWHWGLRNPFRFSFDRASGDIYIGDVGANTCEEIDVAPSGAGIDWGWNMYQCSACFTAPCDPTGRTFPVVERSHASGWLAIIGGAVYRGSCFPDLVGTYFYGSQVTQELAAFEYSGGTATNGRDLGTVGPITAIHPDNDGELYVVTLDGFVRRIVVSP